VVDKNQRSIISDNIFDSDSLAIVLRTVFDFNEKNVSGYLFIVTSEESFAWLKTVLYNFIDQYDL
jgi:chemotaxis protein CheC